MKKITTYLAALLLMGSLTTAQAGETTPQQSSNVFAKITDISYVQSFPITNIDITYTHQCGDQFVRVDQTWSKISFAPELLVRVIVERGLTSCRAADRPVTVPTIVAYYKQSFTVVADMSPQNLCSAEACPLAWQEKNSYCECVDKED